MSLNLDIRRFISLGVILAFLANTFGLMPIAKADEFRLPAPGVMVNLSPEFNPPILKGLKVHPDNPFRFDFILDKGDTVIASAAKVLMPDTRSSSQSLKEQSTTLIKYFLAGLTIPEQDLWVNLSPYEKDRIIPQSFGLTEMGRDLLAEDYMLKQITASLIYPEGETGKKFWKRIYEEATKKFGTPNIPVNTFNKVWIVPEKAVVYENPQNNTAYVVQAKLKVMLDQDYLSLKKHTPSLRGSEAAAAISKRTTNKDVNALGSQIVREIVIPELTKEVNEDKNFSQLRQVYNSLILATWYKKKIKDSILEQVYADKNKVKGLSFPNASAGNPEYIYQRYLQAFKKGVYNYIKEDLDPMTQETIPRKYFSGGVQLNFAMNTTSLEVQNFAITHDKAMLPDETIGSSMEIVTTGLDEVPVLGKFERGIEAHLEGARNYHQRALLDYKDENEKRGMVEYIENNKRGLRIVEITPEKLQNAPDSLKPMSEEDNLVYIAPAGMPLNSDEVKVILEITQLDKESLERMGIKDLKSLAIITDISIAQENTHKPPARDGLTGFLNKDGFTILFDQAIKEQNREQQGSIHFILMLMDLDGFKKVNDTEGHSSGDDILKSVADGLRNLTRASDIIARWGGDEFLLLLPMTPGSKGKDFLSHFQEKLDIEMGKINLNRGNKVSFSVGTIEVERTIHRGSGMLTDGYITGLYNGAFTRADKLLYEAKKYKVEGKNRIERGVYTEIEASAQSPAMVSSRIDSAMKANRLENLKLYEFMVGKKAEAPVNVTKYFEKTKSRFQNGFYWVDGMTIPKRTISHFGNNLESAWVIDQQEVEGKTWVRFTVAQKGQRPRDVYGHWDGTEFQAMEPAAFKLYQFLVNDEIVPGEGSIDVTKYFDETSGQFKSGFYWSYGKEIPHRSNSTFGHNLESVWVMEKQVVEGRAWLRFKVTQKGEKPRDIYGHWDGAKFHVMGQAAFKLYKFLMNDEIEPRGGTFDIIDLLNKYTGQFRYGLYWAYGESIPVNTASHFGHDLKNVRVTEKEIIDGNVWIKFNVIQEGGKVKDLYGYWDGQHWNTVEAGDWDTYKATMNEEGAPTVLNRGRVSVKGPRKAKTVLPSDIENDEHLNNEISNLGFEVKWVDGTILSDRSVWLFGNNLKNVLAIDKEDVEDRTWVKYKVTQINNGVETNKYVYGHWDGTRFHVMGEMAFKLCAFLVSDEIEPPGDGIDITSYFNPFNGDFRSGIYWNYENLIPRETISGLGTNLIKVMVIRRELDEGGKVWLRFSFKRSTESGKIEKRILKGRWDGRIWHYQKKGFSKDQDDDFAQVTNPQKGGIDLTAANMNLQAQNGGTGIKFLISPVMLEQLRNAPGFVPVIINIQPLKSLSVFLGLSPATVQR